MIKKRILMCAESSHLSSGFGNYKREILSRLFNTNKYEIAELSCYRTQDTPKVEPWKIYPVAVNPNVDEGLYQMYMANQNNVFGQWRFEYALLDFRPDIVFDIRDFWYFLYQEISVLRPFYRWIIAPTYDSSPQKIDTLNTYANADLLLFHTNWAKQDLLNSKHGIPFDNIGSVVNDAVDTKIYKPIGFSKSLLKARQGISKNSFIIGSVMRNQQRKLIPNLCKNFSKILQQNPDKDIFLYLHTSYPDSAGWDIPALLLEYGIADRVLITYLCHHCNHCFPSVFRESTTPCLKCNQLSAHPTSPNKAISTTDLNNIYNLFDIYLQYSICEGFGMPQIEAAACGLQIASVDYSAMSEIVENLDGIKVPVKTMFRELESNANRALPDNQAAADILFNFFTQVSAETKANNSIQIRHKCLEYYSWDKTYEIWDECFQTVDIKNKISWDTPMRPTNHENMKVPPNLQPKEFVRYICQHILNEPDLAETAVGQNLVSQLLCGLSARDGMIKHYSQNDALKTFELLLNSKLTYGHLKEHPEFLVSEDFI